MDIFLKRYKFLRPTQEEIENLSTFMFTKGVKFPDGFTGNSSNCLKKE